ncbi:hypothetical protein ACFQL7_15135 [Halocatena marina]|uniref:DedA family protein n=1 Tax=Halocatena marina TaxID=2934937 RepID=A0ABD5YNM1_9EURY
MIDLASLIELIFSFAYTSGLLGLLGVFGYSFLVALVLPMPGEVVLAVPIDLGISRTMTIALIIAISSLGKAIGSLVALRIGEQITQLRPIEALSEYLPSPPTIVERDGRVVGFVQRYGYVGLALALAVPLMPDTAIIYGFSVIKMNPIKFMLAAFTGTIFRLLTVLGQSNSPSPCSDTPVRPSRQKR